MRSIFFLSLTILMLNACGSTNSPISKECAAPETDGREFSGIINGKTLKADGPLSSRVVMLVFKNSESMMECTGAILPNNVILTAGHCVPSESSKIAVAFAADGDCALSGENIRKVSKIVSNPDYVKGNPENDMAMLKFVGSLPAGFQSFEIPGESIEPNKDENLIMLGYGKTSEADDSGSSVLRITANKASSLISILDVDASLTYSIAQPTTGVCSGDSGGPLVVMRAGLPKIIGVASQARGKSEAELCHGEAVYVRADAKAQWILETYKGLAR